MPLADILGTASQQVGGVYAAEQTFVTLGGAGLPGGGVGFCITTLGLQYLKALNPFYEITSSLVYWVSGRSQGQGNMGQILGPGKLQTSFIRAYGDPCKMASRNLGFKGRTQCGLGSTSRDFLDFQANAVTVNQVSFQVEGQNMTIQGQNGFMYTSLTPTENPALAGTGGGGPIGF